MPRYRRARATRRTAYERATRAGRVESEGFRQMRETNDAWWAAYRAADYRGKVELVANLPEAGRDLFPGYFPSTSVH